MNLPPPAWNTAPAPPPLGPSEVHLWRVWFERPGRPLDDLLALLSADERARAERLHFERDRGYFIAGRAILRLLLAGYLHANPAELVFASGPQGKPALAGDQTGLRFNLSHSHGLALYAVTRVCEVGVDVEQARPLPDALSIARRFFSAGEYAALVALPAAQQPEAFFACWTRKEAYLKALGGGITTELARFEVSLRPGDEARLVSVAGDPAEAARWEMAAFSPAPGFVAALAVRSREWHPLFWRWSG